MYTNQVSIIPNQLLKTAVCSAYMHNTTDDGIWLSEKMEALEMPLMKFLFDGINLTPRFTSYLFLLQLSLDSESSV